MIKGNQPDIRADILLGQVKRCSILPEYMAEFGCFSGATSLLIAQACPYKKLVVFDSFAGLPEDDPYGCHKKGDYAASFNCVKEVLKDYDIEFHVGFFPETVKGTEDYIYSFVHVDCDLYSSCVAAIKYFWPRLGKYAAICFDDFNSHYTSGITKAVTEFFPSHMINYVNGVYSCFVIK